MPRYIDATSLEELCEIMAEKCDDGTGESLWNQFRKVVESCPTADVVERKASKWVKMSDADGVYWACNECGEDIPRISHYNPQFDLFPRLESIDKTKYCPNCGARMEVDE